MIKQFRSLISLSITPSQKRQRLIITLVLMLVPYLVLFTCNAATPPPSSSLAQQRAEQGNTSDPMWRRVFRAVLNAPDLIRGSDGRIPVISDLADLAKTFTKWLFDQVMGLIQWLLAEVMRPIIKALLFHSFTLLHNPNIASLEDDRAYVVGGERVLYDLITKDVKRGINFGFELCRRIAIALILLLFILNIWKYWVDASCRSGMNLMLTVGRLIATVALIMFWPTISEHYVRITNEMIDLMLQSIDLSSLNRALDKIVEYAVKGAGGLIMGTVGLIITRTASPGVLTQVAGGGLQVAGNMLYLIFLGTIIYQTVSFLVLKAVQTALMMAQFMFAPLFLCFFASTSTERITATFIRSCIEVSLWTFVWCGLLRLLIVVLITDQQSTYVPWGHFLMIMGILQIMISIPQFMGQAQISPVSEFISPRGAMNAISSMASGFGEIVSGAIKANRAKKPTPNSSSPFTPPAAPFNGPGNPGPGGGNNGGNNGGNGGTGANGRNGGAGFNGGGSPTSGSTLGSGPPLKTPGGTGAAGDKGAGDPTSLNDKQLNALAGLEKGDKDALKGLTDEEARGLAPHLNEKHMAALAKASPEDLAKVAPHLNPQQLKELGQHLSPQQLAAMYPSLNAEQKEALSERISGLKEEELNGLNHKELANLYPALSPEQKSMGAVANKLKGLDQAQLGALTPEQRQNIAGALTPEQLNGMSNSNLADLYPHLNDTQKGAVGDKLKGLNNDDIGKLTAPQKRNIAGALSNDQLTRLPAKDMADMYPALSAGQKDAAANTLNGYSNSELAGLSNEQLTNIAPGLKPDRLQSISGLSAQKLAALASGLDETQRPNLKNAADALDEDQLAGLTKEEFGALAPCMSESKLQSLSSSDKLSPSQLAAVHNALPPAARSAVGAKLAGLSDEKLATLSGGELASVSGSLPAERVKRLADSGKLNAKQLAGLASAAAPGNKGALAGAVSNLKRDDLATLTPSEVHSLGELMSVEQACNLSPEQIRGLGNSVDDQFIETAAYSGGMNAAQLTALKSLPEAQSEDLQAAIADSLNERPAQEFVDFGNQMTAAEINDLGSCLSDGKKAEIASLATDVPPSGWDAEELLDGGGAAFDSGGGAVVTGGASSTGGGAVLNGGRAPLPTPSVEGPRHPLSPQPMSGRALLRRLNDQGARDLRDGKLRIGRSQNGGSSMEHRQRYDQLNFAEGTTAHQQAMGFMMANMSRMVHNDSQAESAALASCKGYTGEPLASMDGATRGYYAQQMRHEAVVGTQAYFNGQKGNAYTQFLRNTFGGVNGEVIGGEVGRLLNADLPESPFNQSYDKAAARCETAGLAPFASNLAVAARSETSKVNGAALGKVSGAIRQHAWDQISDSYGNAPVDVQDAALAHQIQAMPSKDVSQIVKSTLGLSSGRDRESASVETPGRGGRVEVDGDGDDGDDPGEVAVPIVGDSGSRMVPPGRSASVDALYGSGPIIVGGETASFAGNTFTGGGSFVGAGYGGDEYAHTMVSGDDSGVAENFVYSSDGSGAVIVGGYSGGTINSIDTVNAGGAGGARPQIRLPGGSTNHSEIARVTGISDRPNIEALGIVQANEPELNDAHVAAISKVPNIDVSGRRGPGRRAQMVRNIASYAQAQVGPDGDAAQYINDNVTPQMVEAFYDMPHSFVIGREPLGVEIAESLLRTEVRTLGDRERLPAARGLARFADTLSNDGGGEVAIDALEPEIVRSCIAIGARGGDTSNTDLVAAVSTVAGESEKLDDYYQAYYKVDALTRNHPEPRMPAPSPQTGATVISSGGPRPKIALGSATWKAAAVVPERFGGQEGSTAASSSGSVVPDKAAQLIQSHYRGVSAVADPNVAAVIAQIDSFNPGLHRAACELLRSNTAEFNLGSVIVYDRALNAGITNPSKNDLIVLEHMMAENQEITPDNFRMAFDGMNTASQGSPFIPPPRYTGDDKFN